MFYYFQPIYLEQLGADPIVIGGILSAAAIAMTLTHIPAGYLSDRYGRRLMLLMGWVSGLIATWIMALANSLPMFIVGVILYGATLFVMVPLNSYITAARGKRTVGRALTLISVFYNLGAIIGPILGGQVAERYGLRQIYFIAAVSFVISTVIVFQIRSQPVEKSASKEVGRGNLIDRRLIGFYVIIFFSMFAMYLPQPLSSIFLQDQRAISLADIGQLGTMTSIGIVISNLFIGQLNVRSGFLLSQVFVGMFAFTLLRGTGMGWYRIGYVLVGAYRTARSLATAQTSKFVQAARMGLAYSVTETVMSMAIIIAPLLAGFIYDHNPEWMYSISLVLLLTSIIIGVTFIKPDVTEIPESEQMKEIR